MHANFYVLLGTKLEHSRPNHTYPGIRLVKRVVGLFMLALMKKEEELLYRLKKKNGGHLSARGAQKHMTLYYKKYDLMVLCATYVTQPVHLAIFRNFWELRD